MKDNSNSLGATIGKIMFYLLAIGLLIWTASLTQELVSMILPDNVILSWFALLLFDGGALIWLLVFMFVAAGPGQRAIAGLLMAFDLLGVGLMSFADLYMAGQTLTAIPAFLGTAVVWGVGLSTILNVVALYAFHISDPENVVKMRLRAMADSIRMTSIDEAEKRIESRARAAGDILAERMVSGTMAGFNLPIDIGAKVSGAKPVQAAPVTFAAESDVAINGTSDDTDFLPPPSKPTRTRRKSVQD